MKKFMFDSNIFDRLPEFIDQIQDSHIPNEYYVTTIQIDELCEIPDSKIDIRKRNILMLAYLRAKLVPVSVFVLNGRVRLNHVRFGDGTVYRKILNENSSNIDDAMIADTAVFEGCTLITEDIKLYGKMKTSGYAVMSLSNFLETLKDYKDS